MIKKLKKSKNLVKAFELLTQLPDDFFAEGRKDPPPQEREDFVCCSKGTFLLSYDIFQIN